MGEFIMRSIEQKICVDGDGLDVFNSLITPSRINDWWKTSTAIVNPKKGGIWMAAWGEDIDAPDYVTSAVLSEFEPGKRLVMSNFDYMSKSGPLPFEAEFETSFSITGLSGTETELTVIQTGFPEEKTADEFYAGCLRGWADTLASLKIHLQKSR